MEKYNKQRLSLLVRKNIKKYRLLKKFTLQELADRIDMTHGYVRDLESYGINKTPSLETLGKFANALEIDINKLFEEKD